MENKAKTEKIELFIAPEDKELILRGAKKAGMTLSAYVRYTALLDMAMEGDALAWKRLAGDAKRMLASRLRKFLAKESMAPAP